MIVLKIKDPTRRAAYIKDFSIQKYFSVPIENYLEVHTFRKGEFICEERKAPQRLYFIKEGEVQLYLIHQDGNVSLAQYYQPGDVLGELELLGIRSQSQSIQAIKDTVCIALPFDPCKDMILADPVFMQNLCRFIADKMLRSVGKLVSTQTYPLENRLAAFLIDREERPGDWITLRLTDLAQYLGVSYRHLSRVVKQFSDAGWIHKDRTRLRIINNNALEELVAQMETE